MQLPRSVQEIADVLGEEKALFLIGKLPRCYNQQQFHVILYVPTLGRLTLTHNLVQILGWPDAVKLSKAFGGEILKPAPCTSLYRPFRDENIIRLVKEGVPPAMVATWFDVSERLVKNLVREIPQEECQAANDNNGASLTKTRRKHHDERQTA